MKIEKIVVEDYIGKPSLVKIPRSEKTKTADFLKN